MGKYPPPDALPGVPTRAVLRKGTPMYRVHSTHREPTAYNSQRAHPFYFGGRFDSTLFDSYGYLYVGFSVGAAISEVLLRSVPIDTDSGERLLLRKSFERRSLSFLRLAADIEVVSLMSGRDLSAVAQTGWLVQAEGADYPQTRDWGHWIRRQTKAWAQGFVWPSKREPADRVAILFDDRGESAVLEPTGVASIDFGTEEGERWLNGVLRPYHTHTAPRGL
ncbi:RES family NAD+ phosphorylase [Streptomyces sparsogenes]|uniref:RES family NAD+ phosphorylase n=1 Tax=Streptomyces sparsogenes TaxID=67365 RepID=UPI00384C1F31